MGKFLKITAIFHTDKAANAYLETHKDEGVVACFGDMVLIANLYDRGTEWSFINKQFS
jgi:hypothetical protein